VIGLQIQQCTSYTTAKIVALHIQLRWRKHWARGWGFLCKTMSLWFAWAL